MRKFKIGYSNNGSDWKMIMDDSKRKAKVSPGRGWRREGLGAPGGLGLNQGPWPLPGLISLIS